uniref:Uncharacterized protein n=1 Tax=Anguilla anguilla TaxID=7936 RepID=A0A0E9TUX0_ANGAN
MRNLYIIGIPMWQTHHTQLLP